MVLIPLLLLLIILFQIHSFAAAINMSKKVITSQGSIKSFFRLTATAPNSHKSNAPSPVKIVSDEKEPESKKQRVDSAAIVSSSNITINDGTITLWQPLQYLNEDWRNRLSSEYKKPYFKSLMAFVDGEMSRHTVYPPVNDIFTALNLCSFDNCRVVIIGMVYLWSSFYYQLFCFCFISMHPFVYLSLLIGQDPYHGPGQAHGLAFSVKKGIVTPPSLQNMIKEAKVSSVHIVQLLSNDVQDICCLQLMS